MPVCGIIDAKVSVTDSDNSHKEAFKIVYNFFQRMVAVGNCTRKALQYGLGGTGTGWWDEGTPFGANAFAVYEFNSTPKFSVLVQFGTNTNKFGTSPGNPGALNGSASAVGVGVAMAARLDGTSPWGGGTGNAGADTKSTPVWTPGTSTLYVVDRACSSITTAGSYATNKENAIRVDPSGYSRYRMHCVGSADGFCVLSSHNDTGIYTFCAGGRYTPRPGLTSSHVLPLALWGFNSLTNGHFDFGTSTAYGIAAGTGTYEGGVIGRPADYVGELYINPAPSAFHDSSFQPNMQPTDPEFDLSPYGFAFGHLSRKGYLGSFACSDLVSYCYNTNNHQTNSAGTKAYLGHTTVAGAKYAIPWDGGRAPGNNMTRDGRTF